jgi:hypothetical protein
VELNQAEIELSRWLPATDDVNYLVSLIQGLMGSARGHDDRLARPNLPVHPCKPDGQHTIDDREVLLDLGMHMFNGNCSAWVEVEIDLEGSAVRLRSGSPKDESLPGEMVVDGIACTRKKRRLDRRYGEDDSMQERPDQEVGEQSKTAPEEYRT